jgi:hypothetical protein
MKHFVKQAPQRSKADKRILGSRRTLPARDTVQVTRITAVTPEGLVVLSLGDAAEGIPARCGVPVSSLDLGKEAVVVYDDGDPTRPIIIGVLQPAATSPPLIRCDDRDLVLRAERQIELRCGEASLILTRAGKVIIRGSYVLSRSTGVNRIKGASVQIN